VTVNSPTLAQLATERPTSVKVLQRHGLDFCCGGKRTLEDACSAKQIDPAGLLAEIALEEERAHAASEHLGRWDREPVEELITHILKTYHRPLDEDLPRLEQLARKVAARHGDKAPETLPALLETFLALKAELEPHMRKEEQVLFPMILAGRGPQTGGPVACMQAEHDHAGALLLRLRTLTSDYALPAQACRSWTALWEGLEALERELHEHIHLENNVLFPRALGQA
jgi:regulator of cell morphogenesis and NO signaling